MLMVSPYTLLLIKSTVITHLYYYCIAEDIFLHLLPLSITINSDSANFFLLYSSKIMHVEITLPCLLMATCLCLMIYYIIKI
jgi:hypothetical protein